MDISWVKRYFKIFAVLTPLLAGLVLIEAVARWQKLDRLQGTIVQAEFLPDLQAVPDEGRIQGVAYLPRGLKVQDGGFETRWGKCRKDWPGETLMVLGDSTTLQSAPDEVAFTWPMFLRKLIPETYQVCVLAEMGYSPADEISLFLAVGRSVNPKHVIMLSCENDLMIRGFTAYLAEHDGAEVWFTPASGWRVWRPLHNPWLLGKSEAFRFVHWTLAKDRGDALLVPTAAARYPNVATLFKRLRQEFPTTVFYLPRLKVGWDDVQPLAGFKIRAGTKVNRIDLPLPFSQWRKEASDEIHVNAAGHQWIAQFVFKTMALPGR